MMLNEHGGRRALLLVTTVLMGSVLACAPTRSGVRARAQAPSTPTSRPAPTNSYVDAKLGFSIALPGADWSASPEPGLQQAPHISALTLLGDEQNTHQQIVIGVLESAAMPAAFALRGTPTTRIGPYPAFADDRMGILARDPCLVRIFLAHDDYVMATWCSAGSARYSSQFDQLLATYLPAAPGFVSHAAAAPAAENCADVKSSLGYDPSDATWGNPLGSPTQVSPAGGWRQLNSGIYLCSNAGSPDLYLFQCTELVNRYLYEQWALPHIPGNAARYFDYYQNGRMYPGVIRDLPAGTYQLSSDASQADSSFAPQAGDLLVFQDVNDPAVGWISGLADSPGHIAVVTGVDARDVYVAQENYNDTQYFLALPVTRVPGGWHITDLSGLSNRIVRGWIHLTLSTLG